MSEELAGHLIDDLGAMLLFTMLLILASGQLFRAIYAVSLQSVFLSIAGAILASATGNVDLWIIAGITILIKAIFLPWLLIWVVKRIGIQTRAPEWRHGEYPHLRALSSCGTGLPSP